jgi:hypothetical protein
VQKKFAMISVYLAKQETTQNVFMEAYKFSGIFLAMTISGIKLIFSFCGIASIPN